MPSAKTDHYRAKLQQILDDLTGQDDLGQDGQKTVMLDQQSVGRLSRMDALQQQAMARATQQRRDQQRLRIRAALARIDDGEYGYCIDCGEEIPAARLELDPAAPKCLSCTRG
ncbi:MAG: TraR/DksA C4-type zinc finger protein [Paracoccaceae bacterium]|nr:TraR/DksA C4-type zinc finger protein [Paracoccaceae bacterium]